MFFKHLHPTICNNFWCLYFDLCSPVLDSCSLCFLIICSVWCFVGSTFMLCFPSVCSTLHTHLSAICDHASCFHLLITMPGLSTPACLLFTSVFICSWFWGLFKYVGFISAAWTLGSTSSTPPAFLVSNKLTFQIKSEQQVTSVLVRVKGQPSYRCCLCASCISRARSTATGPGACSCWSDGTASSSPLPWRQSGVCSPLRRRTAHLPWSCTSCQNLLTHKKKRRKTPQPGQNLNASDYE